MTNAGRLSVRLIPVLLAGFVALTPFGQPLRAQDSPDLGSLSVDDLMNVEVTSVARKGQKLADTAAAVFVITQEEIRRSGATTIPEVLRMVPGLNVARVNGNVWAISARGFNGRFANKLLVMIDGRSVYTPLFSGVYWDVQDTVLEDVDRIEVIRGPGGTLWGANAVSGIINIITKHSIETQGTLVSAGGGASEGPAATGRFGGSIGDHGHYRVYGKWFDRPASAGGTTTSLDASTASRAGFRADWSSRRGHDFTLQGDIHRGSETTPGLLDGARPFADRASREQVEGGDLLFRWTAVQSMRSDTTVQAFYDYAGRSMPTSLLSRRRLDIDFQQHLRLGQRHDLVWGAEVRHTSDSTGGLGIALIRDSNVASLGTAFVQDEIGISQRIRVTVGTKLQYDAASQLQMQPTLRLLFKAGERQTLWAAATSAVRTPSEVELYGRVNLSSFATRPGSTGLVVLTGNPDLEPERVEAYEAGYRWQVTPQIALDATAFHNRMRGLVGTGASAPFVDSIGRTIIPVRMTNAADRQAHGTELLLTNAIADNWDVTLGYSFFQLADTRGEGPRPDSELTVPRHQVQLRSAMQLPRRIELDWSAHYVGPIATEVPAYVRLDAQLCWRTSGHWELSIAGQNLLDARHTEFIDGHGAPAIPIERTVNGRITWRF